MKNIRTLHLVIIVSAFVLFSCDERVETSGDYRALAGTWEWVRSDGGIAYNIHETPASTGENIEWKFASDRSYTIFVKDVLRSEGSYSLERKECIHSSAKKLMIHFSDPLQPDMMIESVNAGSLFLSDECFDGIASEFRHKSETSGN
jgi:hypothetical protein